MGSKEHEKRTLASHLQPIQMRKRERNREIKTDRETDGQTNGEGNIERRAEGKEKQSGSGREWGERERKTCDMK